MNGQRKYENGSDKQNIVRAFEYRDDSFGFQTQLPIAFKRLLVEFHMHAERGFDACMDPTDEHYDDCLKNVLFVSIGNNMADYVTIGLGVDEFTITGFAGKCHDMKKWLYNLYQNRAA